MFFNKKNENPLLDLRQKIMSGKIQISETIGNNQVAAVIIDIGSNNGACSLVVISDGSCSLYFEKGGGIIGAGQHKNVQYVCKILLNAANDLIEEPASKIIYDFPTDKNYIVHVMTRNGVYNFSGRTDNSSEQNSSNKLFYLCNSVITQLRLLDEKNNTPLTNDEILINFVRENNYKAFKYALEDLNNANAILGDKSALMFATYNGNKEIVKDLINKGANINYKERTGLNSLMLANYLGKVDLFDEFVNDETINAKDNSGKTPLMFSCGAGHVDCVKALIIKGADINATDNEGSTPIMYAAQHGNDEIVKYLLEKGANKSLKGDHGFRAIDFALQNNHSSTVLLLKD